LPESLGKAYSRYFLLLWVSSFVFLLVCILSASFLGVGSLLTFGLIYAIMLISSLLVWNLQVESEKHFILAYLVGVSALFGISLLFGVFAQHPQTIIQRLTGTTASTPFSIWDMTPEQLWAFFMNIPGPVAEESFFRIFLWRLLSPALGKTKSAIAQAIAFGIFHFFAYGQDLITMLLAICVGFALGVIYMLTESELGITASHLTYNIIILLI